MLDIEGNNENKDLEIIDQLQKAIGAYRDLVNQFLESEEIKEGPKVTDARYEVTNLIGEAEKLRIDVKQQINEWWDITSELNEEERKREWEREMGMR